VFALANMLDFFTNEFARLRRRGPAGALCLASPLECGFARHDEKITQVLRRDATGSFLSGYHDRVQPGI
jgi:hypothetical protein